jgi:hypothetical protein
MTVPVAPEDFDTALGVLREMGWTQGRSNGPGGAVCLARALNLAYGARTGGRHIRIDGPYESTWMNVARLMGIPASINGVVEWNDLKSTTLEKVEQHLVRAAQKLRQELAIGPTS